MVSLWLSKVHNSDESNPISCRTRRSTFFNSSSSQAKFHLWKWHPASTSHITIGKKKGLLHCLACCSQPNCPCPNIPTIQLCRDTQTCKTSACPGDKCVENFCGNSEQGLRGAAPLSRHSQLSAGSCTHSKLVVVISSSLERQPLNPKCQPVWHWECLNCDPFAFQVPAQQIGAKGEKNG